MIRKLSGPSQGAAAGQADALVVFVHGYGANGDDLFGLADPLSQILPNAAFSAPNAPEKIPMAPMGFQWFPIPWLDGSPEQSMHDGFAQSQKDLNAYLDEELERLSLPHDRLALVGFSQGSMMSLHIGPRRDPGPAGIVGISGRLIEPEKLKAEKKSSPQTLLIHGDMDDVVPVDSIHEAREGLAAAEIPVRWHISRGIGHGIAQDGLQLTAGFLKQVIG